MIVLSEAGNVCNPALLTLAKMGYRVAAADDQDVDGLLWTAAREDARFVADSPLALLGLALLLAPQTAALRMRWGLYPWFEEHGEALIHPEDLETVRALRPHGKVVHVTGVEGPFLRFAYGEIVFRAMPSLLREVDVDVHGIGDRVMLAGGRVGEVVGVHWHYLRAEPMYQLRVAGKVKRKRYWSSDLSRLETR